jgi:hypothetical protein
LYPKEADEIVDPELSVGVYPEDQDQKLPDAQDWRITDITSRHVGPLALSRYSRSIAQQSTLSHEPGNCTSESTIQGDPNVKRRYRLS